MNNKKRLLLIYCQTAGSSNDLSVEVRDILKLHKIKVDFRRVKSPPEIENLIAKVKNDYLTIAVCGGDGSISSAITSLADCATSLLIIPGGTANIIAKDLNIPTSVTEVIEMYVSGKYKINYFDLADVAGLPFVLDMHTGIMNDAIKDTPRSAKKHFGQLAYAMNLLKQLPSSDKQNFKFRLNDKLIHQTAFMMLIANCGRQNLLGARLFPFQHRGGLVQIAFVKSLSPVRIFIWLSAKLLGFHGNYGGAIKTYRATEVTLVDTPRDFLFDDGSTSFKLPLTIRGGRYETKVITAPLEPSSSILNHWIIISRLFSLRIVERLRNIISGQPNFTYTRISPHLYVGGAYRRSAYKTFAKWGITGVVNMRKSIPQDPPEGFKILHLRTQDWHPPTIESFKKGVEFINQQVSKGGSVYVHCRQGEGRGPSMAAAYLISIGLTVDEALSHIQKYRPMAHPNRGQVKRLSEWQEYLVNNKIY